MMSKPAKHFIPPYPKFVPTSKQLYQQGWWPMMKTAYYLNKSPIHAVPVSLFSSSVPFKLLNWDINFLAEKNKINELLAKTNNEVPKSKLINDMLRPLLRDSIFNTNGEQWQKYRDVLSYGLGNIHTRKSFPLMKQTVDDFVSLVGSLNLAKPINIEEHMTHVTADVIFRTILSSSITQAELEEFVTAFIKFQEVFIKSIKFEMIKVKIYTKKLEHYGKRIRDILRSRIEPRYYAFMAGERREDEDILESFFLAGCKNPKHKLSLEEMVDQICMLFLAGHETSAAALSWALYLLANDQATQAEIYHEISQTLGGEPLTFEHLKHLKQVSASFFEAMRLYPPVYILPREISRKINGKNQKKHYFINNWSLHRCPAYWSKPESFCPHRFVEKDYKEYTKEGVYLPFSKGPRACIGKAFAIQEGLVILSLLLKDYQVLPANNKSSKPRGGVTLRTVNGIHIKLSKRMGEAKDGIR